MRDNALNFAGQKAQVARVCLVPIGWHSAVDHHSASRLCLQGLKIIDVSWLEWPLGSISCPQPAWAVRLLHPSPLGDLPADSAEGQVMKKFLLYWKHISSFKAYKLPALTLKISYVRQLPCLWCLRNLQPALSYPAHALLHEVHWRQAVYP